MEEVLVGKFKLLHLQELSRLNRWIEYKNTLYKINWFSNAGNDNQNIAKFSIIKLELSNLFYKEVIKGNSGVVEFGAHMEIFNYEMLITQILVEGKIWSDEKVKRRIRYSSRSGGIAYLSIYENINKYNPFKWVMRKINGAFK